MRGEERREEHHQAATTLGENFLPAAAAAKDLGRRCQPTRLELRGREGSGRGRGGEGRGGERVGVWVKVRVHGGEKGV